MRHEPTCPRCGAEVRPPGLWSSDWQCVQHGVVPPYHVMVHTGQEALDHVVSRSTVPVWFPRGLPGEWLCSGVAYAGDDRSGACASVVSLSGPSPLGGPADLLLVAEEPGVGLGARHSGLPGPDAGIEPDATAPDARLDAAGHPTPLWSAPADDDRAVFVGEAKGFWLWTIVHPAAAGVLMYDEVMLVDARDDPLVGVEFGSVSSRLFDHPA